MKDLLFPENGWIEITPRIQIPSSKDQSWLFKASSLASKWLGRDEVPDVLKLLSINSSIFWSWLHFASKLMPYGKLSSRISELIILRVAWLCRCRYEWRQHIEIGQRRAKLTEQDIFNISKGYTAFQDEKEKSIILACDQLTLNNFIEQNNWDTLNNHLNTSQIIELQMLIGHYSMLAGVINSSGLQLEYSIENNLQEFYRRIQNL